MAPLQVIEPADNPFQRRMADGHQLRKGHALEAVLVSTDGEVWTMIRKCCGETVPE
jgi:hypothetical protein